MTVFHAIVELSKASWRVLRRHPRLLYFPFLSLATMLVLLRWIGVIVIPGDDDEHLPWLSLLVLSSLTYLVHIFYTAALTSEALRALRGDSPSIANGLSTAVARMPAIASFAAITGTFGFLLAMIGRTTRVSVRIARAMVSTAWSLATYLAIPVMVQERRGGLTSLRRSSDLFRRTWGETTLSEVGIRVLTAQLAIVFFMLAVLLLELLGDGIGAVAVLLVAIGFVSLVGTLEAIYRAALYVFAAEGVIPQPFDDPALQDIWRTKH